jgi:hypothetical protein
MGGLEVGAVQFEHAYTGQAGERARGQSSGDRIDRESAAKQEPTEQSSRDRIEKSGEQTCNTGGKKVVGMIIAE